MRDDQEEMEKGEQFETPFSIKAKEDAERFKTSDAPIAKPAVNTSTEEAAAPASANEETESPAAAATAEPGTEAKPEEAAPPQKLDAKEVVAGAMALPNVVGCSVTFVDGLILAGKLPDEVAVEGLCAMAPSLLQRIEKHMADTNLGALKSLTLHCEKSGVTFFTQGNICLTALHSQEGLGRETETKLAEMTSELSRTYAQPGT
jgi:predicted regulator of Ras-like GTPase activity (Roadblock/LC7/MglB family)